MTFPRCLPLTAGCLLLVGCAAALREPPALQALGSATQTPPAGQVPALLADAEAAFAERTLESVGRAADLWLQVAAGETARVDSLVAASKAQAWLAEHFTEPADKQTAAEAAVYAAQWCERTAADDPRCTYYLAIGLGLQARERRSTALDALPRIVERLEQVIEARPELDYGGPHRVLALVLLRAPGWPSGPGDPDRGFEEAEAALAIDPNYPPNQLCFAEAARELGDEDVARAAYTEAARLARAWNVNSVHDAREWMQEAAAALAKLD